MNTEVKPYLITISARRFGIAYASHLLVFLNFTQALVNLIGQTLLCFCYTLIIMVQYYLHNIVMVAVWKITIIHFYRKGFLNSSEGEVQLSNFRVGIDVVLNPMYVSFVSNLRSETKYRLDLGALTTGVQSPQYNSLQYTIQELTT